MQYNTERHQLRMPQYGRSVQDMVEHAVGIEDRTLRQRCANTIVAIMANMQTDVDNEDDMDRRLWDHLAYISDYKLDVDYPYEITRLDSESLTPEPLPYPMQRIGHRHYGHLLEKALGELEKMPECPDRDELLYLVANQMKQSLHDWNLDAMDDQKVAADIAVYTHGKVRLNLDNFRFAPISKMQGGSMQMGKKKKKK